MEKFSLNTQTRQAGKEHARKSRQRGFIPAVLYGKKQEPINIEVSSYELEKCTATKSGMNALFDLSIDGKDHLARIIDFQADVIKRHYIHVDFQAVDLNEKIYVDVPLIFKGKPIGLQKGGILEQQRRSLHLRCAVSKIPDSIEIDITNLDVGSTIHADEVALPEGVEFPHETNFTICGVVTPTKEAASEEPVEGEGGVAEAAAEGATEEKKEA